MRRVILRRARKTWRRSLELDSPNVTRRLVESSALVVGPHPDDETLGAGALIAAMRFQGRPVHMMSVTDGERGQHLELTSAEDLAHLRRSEFRAACKVLGVEEAQISHLGIPDSAIGECLAEVTERIADLLRLLRPDVVLTTSSLDPHPDHQAVSKAVRSVVIGSGIAVCEYPIWAWTMWPWLDRRSLSVSERAR